jgi:hypothetical protein
MISLLRGAIRRCGVRLSPALRAKAKGSAEDRGGRNGAAPARLAKTACLICLLSTGCLRASNETRIVHVFVGAEPVRGAVQVATNRPIPVISVDEGGHPRYEERDCGQFVLVPPHIYREVRRRLEALRDGEEGRRDGSRTDDAGGEGQK